MMPDESFQAKAKMELSGNVIRQGELKMSMTIEPKNLIYWIIKLFDKSAVFSEFYKGWYTDLEEDFKEIEAPEWVWPALKERMEEYRLKNLREGEGKDERQGATEMGPKVD